MEIKVGVVFFTAGWFKDVGLQSGSSDLTIQVESIAKNIINELKVFCKPIYNGIVSSIESAQKTADILIKEDVDALLISPLMWSEDILLKTILKKLPNKPIIFCTFIPYEFFPDYLSFDEMLKGSGTVGSLQMSGFLKREGYNYEPLVGYYKDKNLYLELKKNLSSIFISKDLKDLKVGILPFRCDQMTTTYVDEFIMHKLYGIEFEYLELIKVKEIAQNFSKNDIDVFLTLIYDLGFIIEVDDKNLTEAAKYSLALENIIKERNLKALAINDVIDEMHSCFGLRPCLVNPRLTDYGVSVSMEADIAAVVAMYILNQFTGQKPFYSEILCASLSENSMILGHAGYYEYENADPNYPVKIISDPEYKTTDRFSGACLYYKYKPGPITLINSVYNNEKITWSVTQGFSLEGPPKLEGDPHVYCKLEKPLRVFFEENIKNGVSQHWLVLYGHIADDLKVICRWNNIGFIQI